MPKYVLFVDDEDNIRKSLRRELEEWFEERGLEFAGAASVDEGLTFLAEHHADVQAVVSDLKMPGKKGTVLLKGAAELYPEMASILLTGYSEIEEIKEAIASGILSFIQKPWDPTFLRIELDRAVQLTTLRRERDQYQSRLEKDFLWTRKIHHQFLLNPVLDPSLGHIDLGFSPARGTVDCGGDFFLFLPLDGKPLLVFGDVSVAGVEGTFHAMRLRDHIRDLALNLGEHLSPDRLVEGMNDFLVAHYPDLPGGCMNLAAYRVDAARHVCTYAISGGEQFAIIDPQGHHHIHTLPSPAMGYKDGILFPARTVRLEPGSRLVCLSRDLVERPELRAALDTTLGQATPETPAQDLLDALLPAEGLDEDTALLVYHPAFPS